MRRHEGNRTGGKNAPHSADTVAALLRTREGYKYTDLDAYLSDKHIKHEFECALDNYVFDLYLPARSLFIEFDGPDHLKRGQKTVDLAKTATAGYHGISVLHIPVTAGKTIAVDLVKEYLPDI